MAKAGTGFETIENKDEVMKWKKQDKLMFSAQKNWGLP